MRKIFAEHLYARAKALYRLGFSYDDISRRVGIPKAFITKRAKQDKWERPPPKVIDVDARILEGEMNAETAKHFDGMKGTEAGERVLEEAAARKAINEIEVWKAGAPPEEVSEHDRLVRLRLQLEENFMRSAIRNQNLADTHIQNAEQGGQGLTLKELQTHADITKTNKATVLGSDPVVQVVTRSTKDAQATILMPPDMFNDAPEGEAVDFEPSK